MIIEKITKKELTDLQELYRGLCDDEKSLKEMEEVFEGICQNKDYYLLGAKVEGRVVGTLMGIVGFDLAGKYKHFMTIENVIVDESYRGRGICKKLFHAIEGIALERGCRYIYLVSGETRQIAHQMYKRLGYDCDHVVGFRKYLRD
ncbi:GNAT family N-acetyltransferase [Sporanaerobium hydrogeniformans]|uniref:GNAT family N-acetyltransferase n=1 Tax=Sporanaerobium hydrogeniformans TaxID=3072179 RepID=A0AC61DC23_9FIRM|nr:GNAT family N-acetyltransferase [Sporanaerobium hydrogeniformans]PHV70829.1 GNAT family N-acetyltransferase [Sporanaerobium hydrogeniformans]